MKNVISAYLKGLLFGALSIQQSFKNIVKNYSAMHYFPNGFHLETVKNGTIVILPNRGISHVDGNLTVANFEREYNTFDVICNNFDFQTFYEKLGREFWGDARFTFDELVEFIEECGGVDFEKTVLEFSKNFLNLEDETLLV